VCPREEEVKPDTRAGRQRKIIMANAAGSDTSGRASAYQASLLAKELEYKKRFRRQLGSLGF
jgi:hypothetical protein